MNATSYPTLRSHLAYLRLNTAEKVLAEQLELARQEGSSHVEFMERLMAEEVNATSERRLRGRLRFAHIPVEKGLANSTSTSRPRWIASWSRSWQR